MSSLRKALVFFLLSALFAGKLEPSCAHSLLQRNSPRSEFDCVLTQRELRRFSGGEEGRWLVTDSGLETLNGDIQTLVNCTEEGDVLLFDVQAPVQPPRLITIPWNLTLSSFVEDSRLGDGTVSEATRKVTVLCPAEDEGVFLVETNECLFANFIFLNCSLNYRREDAPYGILTAANCSTSQNLGTIRLQHIDFEANFLNRSAALYVQEPPCSAIQMINVTFQNNFCVGTCMASIPSRSEIQNTTLTRNRFFQEDVSSPVLIRVHSGSNTTVDGLTASENNGTAVHVQNTNLRISNSHIFQNSGGLSRNGDDTSGVTLLDSFGEILDSRFEENTGHVGSSIAIQNSTIAIRRTGVIGCNATARGGGISITRSSIVRILDSVIANNSAGSNGGGVYSNGARSLEIENTTFVRNSAEEGGGIYGDALALASLLSCHFVRNTASHAGGGAFFDSGTYTIDSSIFEENASEQFGGGFSSSHSRLNVSDTKFLGNNAPSGGAGSIGGGKSSAWFANCTWRSNVAYSAGGGVAFESGTSATITNSAFSFNQAESGGGAYATDANIRLLNVSGNSNTAARSGAVLYFTESNGTVSNCSFHRNTASFGGALMFFNSVTEVSVSNFVSNEASTDGGAVSCRGSGSLTIADCSFASNSANRSGGAISVSESMVSATYLRFQSNSASGFGGAVILRDNATALFFHSQFFGDFSGGRGGAIYARVSELTLRNISIASCSAESGGGVYFFQSLAYINDTSVTRCEAFESGGGILMAESNVTSSGLNISLNSAVGTSRVRSTGGGIEMEGSSALSLQNVTLDGNMAQYGAGIYVREQCIVLVSNGTLCNNSARMSGGSVYVFNSSLTLNDSQLINSSSTDAGGSILAQGGSNVVMEGTTVQSSRAGSGGGIMLTSSFFHGYRIHFRNCSARAHGGGVGLNESSSFLCTDCVFEGNSALQEGGALRLESLEPQRLAFQLEDTVFQNNDAAFGGAIHFQTGDGTANCSNVNSTECTFLALTGCVLANNHARSIGGAILANNPNGIRLSCHASNKTNPFAYYTLEEFGTLSEFSNLDVACGNWTENSASTYGPIIGSYARRLSKRVLLGPDNTVEIPGNRYVLRNHQSGYPLPTISLEALDEFSQGPALIQGNRPIEAVMTSPDGLFAEIFIVRMEDSGGSFSGITAFNEPGSYDIHINFSELAMPTLIIEVEIRHCLIGEAKAGNGTLCEPCGDKTYSFHPLTNEECSACPEDANCDSVAIRPKQGFWHQTPCSTHLQRCLSERACDEEGRDIRLLELGSDIEECAFDDEFVSNYSEVLCREGYTGPLCGSCKPSHGKSRSFRCEECYERIVGVCVVVLAALVLLGLSAFSITSALPVNKHPSSTNEPRREESSPSSPSNVQMAEVSHTGDVSQEIISAHPATQDTNSIALAASQQGERNAELAKWKAVEIFKITINYLQVIAIAISVSVAWSGALIGLFETAEFIGGVTSEAAGRSTDCLVSSDSSIPRSGISTIVKLITPAMVGLFFVAFWTLAMVKKRQGHLYLIKRCLLSLLVVGYLSYIAITKTAVNVFYCVDVYDSDELGDASTTKYWAVDTALKCYDGSHNVLVFAFGLPALALFSLGFPVLVAYLLIKKRSQEGIHSPWLFETAGFLYRSYNQKFIFWESVILLRKAALAVIVVFAYPLGGNLQGILAVCVLVIALYFHTLCNPYRSEFNTLNQLEGLSLLISSLTFVSGLFFNDDRTSPEARTTIAVFIILANIGILIYFLVRFFVAGSTYLRIVLENEGVVYDQHATAFHIVKTFVKSRLDVHHEESIPSGVGV